MQIDSETFYEAISQADLERDSVTTSYSGRGMFGEECVGVVADNMSEVFLFMAAFGSIGDDWDLLATKARTDDMGKGVIVYFPGVTLSG